jgi:hypothetical protein
MTPAGSWAGRATRAALHGLCLDLSEGIVRYLSGTVESLATGVNEAGLAIGRSKDSWLTDHPLAWDAAVDAVTDLNDGITGDVGWTVFEVWGVNDPGQVIGFGTAVLVGIYHQRG